MPRLPQGQTESMTLTLPRVQQTGPTRELPEAAAIVGLHLLLQSQHDAATRASLDGDVEMKQLQQQIEEDPAIEPAMRAQVFQEKSQAIIEKQVNSLGIPSAKADAEASLNQRHMETMLSIQHGAYQDQRAQSIALLNSVENQYVTEAALSPIPSVRDARKVEYLQKVDSNGFLTDAEKIERRSKWDQRVQTTQMHQLAIDNPQMAMSILRDPEQMQAIAPDDRLVLEQTARVEKDRQETELKQAKNEAVNAASDLWIQRIYTPDAGKLPSIDQVVNDPALKGEPDLKKKFIDIIEERSKGASADHRSEAVEMDIISRIRDPNRADRITSQQQIVPYIGGDGLTAAGARRAFNDLETYSKNPLIKEQDQQLEAYMKGARDEIIRGQFGLPHDPLRVQRAWEFSYEVQRQWDAARAAGEDPAKKLLDKNSKDYVEHLVPQFIPSRAESAAYMTEQAKAAAARPAYPTPTEGVPQYLAPLEPDQIRPDGTPKDVGFLGPLRIDHGINGPGFATEFSIPMYEKGNPGEPGYEKGPDIPTLVPTLTKSEVDQMVNDIIPNMKPVPQPIVDKAIAHAKKRIAEGKSPFFSSFEANTPAQAPLRKPGETMEEWLKRTGQ